jgi:hypothetical protein
MELSKVLDGFTVAETLVIKAQVQVIRWTITRKDFVVLLPIRCFPV